MEYVSSNYIIIAGSFIIARRTGAAVPVVTPDQVSNCFEIVKH
jgi:hypothetical protein